MATGHKIPGSSWRAIIESAMYANSVRQTNMAELYQLALRQPEVVATSQPMYRPEQFGLPDDARILVSNDGSVVGHTPGARLLTRDFSKAQSDRYQAILREAVYGFNRRPGMHLVGIVGMHPDFMVKAHLLSPESDAKNMMDWGINFLPFTKPWSETYAGSRLVDEPDILIFADPEWSHPDFPDGCVLIDESNNCIAILGLRYFGERKNGTLTLAWTIGVRLNMVPCHGGIKTIGQRPPVAIFGLTGSGKSSLTNSMDHYGLLTPEEEVTVLHDDAFLIDLENDITVAVEPSLFDRTDTDTLNDPHSRYYYSAMNVGVTHISNGQRLMINGDVRNPNGRCLKSRDMLRHCEHSKRPGMVIWLQKDTSLPPVCKVNGSALSVAIGASLSTMNKRPEAHAATREDDKLIIEPFANPHRVHSLLEDCEQFRKLFKMGCQCYIMNTSAFGLGDDMVDIPKELTMAIVTELVRGNIEWREWRTFHGLLIPRNAQKFFGDDYDKKYKPRRSKPYLQFLRDRLQDRITFLSNMRDVEHDMSNNFIAPLVAARNTMDKILEPDLYV